MNKIEKISNNWPANGLERVPACPLCQSVNPREEMDNLEDAIFGAPGKWTLYRCLNCLCAYLNPRPDQATISLAYQSYYTHSSASTKTWGGWIRSAIANSLRNRLFRTTLKPSMIGGWILASIDRRRAHSIRVEGRGFDALVGSTGDLLDVGCGNGGFLSLAKAAGWQCFGVEPDPEAVRVAQANGATILGAHLSELRGHYADRFDVITLSHVIEHVHDPDALLRDCWNMLKAGGYFWIETPNIDSMGYEIYASAWRGLEPPRHLILFNCEALSNSLKRAGFNDVTVLPPRDVIDIVFYQSALIAAGYAVDADQSMLTKAAQRTLRMNVKRARRFIRSEPNRSEFITAVAYKR